MKQFIDSIDTLPLLVKVILAIPALDRKDTVSLIISIILLFIPFMWVIDIIFILLKGNVWSYKAA